MASTLKKAFSSMKSFIWGEEDEDLFLDADKNYESPSNVGSVTRKTGVVTTIDWNCILIDHQFGFPLANNAPEFTVGCEVWFYLRDMPNGNRIVTDAGLLDDEESESHGWDSNVATITKVHGQELFLDNQMTCNLDLIGLRSGYTPMTGDHIIFKKRKVRNHDVIFKILPASEESKDGIVCEVSGSISFILSGGEKIWFMGDAFVKSYVPMVGDLVRFTAIRCDHPDKPGRRAINVEYLDKEETFEGVKHPEEYYDIEISSDTKFEKVLIGDDSKTITVHITNKGAKTVTLLKGSFRRNQIQLSVSDIKFPVQIFRSSTQSLTFRLKPAYVGPNVEIYDFYFNGFRISRCFEMMVIAPLIENYSCRGVGYRRPPIKLYERAAGDSFTFGTSPFVRKYFREKGEKFIVPDKLKEVLVEDNRKVVLAAIREHFPVFTELLTMSNYTKKLHYLLYLEEVFLKFEIDKLRRNHVFLKRSGQYLVLRIPGLTEQRPSPVIGDSVIVTQPWLNESNGHVGFIHKVALDALYIDFNDAFKNNYDETDCNVAFQCQNTSSTLMHRAINRAILNLGASMLFPSVLEKKEPWFNVKEEDIGWYNNSLNEFQRKAVVNVLHASCRPLPYVIFGPPGTGKTSTVTELVLQIMRYGNSKILVTAPSNSAANLLSKRLIQSGKLSEHELLRIVSFCRFADVVDSEIESYCKTLDDDSQSPVVLGWHKITVGTCTSIGRLYEMVPTGHFSHIIIDEAGCASEPQALIPLNFLCKNGVVVLAGDPEQLGPTLYSYLSRLHGLSESYLARLMKRDLYQWNQTKYPNSNGFNPDLITCLKLNYRSVPEILAVPNRLFYHSDLEATITGKIGREAEIINKFFELHPIRDKPASIIFHGIRGSNHRDVDSPSWLNPYELFQVVQYVNDFLKIGVIPDEIGIIAPYRKQVSKVRELLRELNIEGIKVGSVEEFQGQERQVIILSTVRSTLRLVENDNRHLIGFLCDPRRFNVAITRARCMLIVLGNPHLLSSDSYWRALLVYCLESNTYIGCDVPKDLASSQANAIPSGDFETSNDELTQSRLNPVMEKEAQNSNLETINDESVENDPFENQLWDRSNEEDISLIM